MTHEEELENELVELRRPVLVKVRGKRQLLVRHGNLDKGHHAYTKSTDGGVVQWISAIPLIEVVDA